MGLDSVHQLIPALSIVLWVLGFQWIALWETINNTSSSKHKSPANKAVLGSIKPPVLQYPFNVNLIFCIFTETKNSQSLQFTQNICIKHSLLLFASLFPKCQRKALIAKFKAMYIRWSVLNLYVLLQEKLGGRCQGKQKTETNLGRAGGRQVVVRNKAHIRNVELGPRDNRTFAATGPHHQGQLTCLLSPSHWWTVWTLSLAGDWGVRVKGEVQSSPLCDLGCGSMSIRLLERRWLLWLFSLKEGHGLERNRLVIKL